MEGLKGVTGISDDVCVYGENSEDHDRHLTNLMERAHEEGLVFNSAKCLIKQRSNSFFGTSTPTMGSYLTMTKFGTSKTCRHPKIGKICIDSSG